METITELTFLRPHSAWLLPVLWVTVYRLHRRNDPLQSQALSWFTADLLRFLTNTSASTSLPVWLRAGNYLAAFLLVIALSGPSLPKQNAEGFERPHGVVFVLDVSLSMLATDMSPNRLTQAKFMVSDLLKAAPQIDAGLIVYDDFAYPIVPISPSKALLQAQLPLIHPDIMPNAGRRKSNSAANALRDASVMLTQSGYSQGDIIWLRDSPEDVPDNPHRLSVLVFGSQNGATIRLTDQTLLKSENGHPVFHKVDPTATQALEGKVHGVFETIALAQSPPESLITLLNQPPAAQYNKTTHIDSIYAPQRQDIGVYFLLPLLVFIALLCFQRAGPLYFSFGLLSCLGLLTHQPVAFAVPTESDAMKAFEQGDFAQAAALFDDPKWQAQAHMAAQNYVDAISLLSEFDDPISQYNLAISLTAEKRYTEAVKAYEKTLSKRTNFIEARENRDALQAFLDQQQSDSQGNESGKPKQNEDQSISAQSHQQSTAIEDKQQAPNDTSQQGGKSPPDALADPTQDVSQHSTANFKQTAQSFEMADSQAEKGEGKNQFEQNSTNPRKSNHTQRELSAGSATQNSKQAQYINALINRVPDEPAFLLQRRLRLMYEKQGHHREPASSEERL